jgi:hypothetical protein
VLAGFGLLSDAKGMEVTVSGKLLCLPFVTYAESENLRTLTDV